VPFSPGTGLGPNEVHFISNKFLMIFSSIHSGLKNENQGIQKKRGKKILVLAGKNTDVEEENKIEKELPSLIIMIWLFVVAGVEHYAIYVDQIEMCLEI
jgi:hypothetical protein